MTAPTRQPWGRLGWCAGAAALVLLGACSDGDGDDEQTPTGASAPAEQGGAPEVPDISPAGAGTVVVGRTTSTFEVTACQVEPGADEPAGARTLFAASGSGVTASGLEFAVEVQRFVTGTDVETFTDTVTYQDPGRILQAQRIEVAGQVTDLRDAEATSPLLRLRADGASASGLAGPPGQMADDEGIIGIALDLTCP